MSGRGSSDAAPDVLKHLFALAFLIILHRSHLQPVHHRAFLSQTRLELVLPAVLLVQQHGRALGARRLYRPLSLRLLRLLLAAPGGQGVVLLLGELGVLVVLTASAVLSLRHL